MTAFREPSPTNVRKEVDEESPGLSADEDKIVTVSDVIEKIGLTTHHWHTIYVTWAIWIFCGWSATTVVYLLDAAGERGSAWTRLTSSNERLTMDNKALVLLLSGIIAAFGNQVLGAGSDLWGRMFMTECCIANGVVAAIGFLLARVKLVLMFCLCLNPFLKDGASFVSNAMLAEWLPIQWRGIFIVTLHIFWNVGRLLITLVWAIVPPTEHWLLFFTISAIIPVVLCLYLRLRGWRYESPRWLAVSGKMDRCIENLKLAASSSKGGTEGLPAGWDDAKILKCSSSSGDAVQVGESLILQQMSELLHPEMRYLVIMLGTIFFLLMYTALGYFFWLIEYFKMAGLHDAIVPSMFAAPIGKIVGNLLLIVGGSGRSIIDRFPRIPIMQVGFFGCAACILLLCMTSNTVLIVACVFVSQVCEEIIWGGGCVYITEAFPTTVRNTASGVIFTVGQIGGIFGSTLSGEMMELQLYLPMGAMAVAFVVAGFLCFALPTESGDKPLADTLSARRDYNSMGTA